MNLTDLSNFMSEISENRTKLTVVFCGRAAIMSLQ